jgi:sortase (surface protein transpeptidase)
MTRHNKKRLKRALAGVILAGLTGLLFLYFYKPEQSQIPARQQITQAPEQVATSKVSYRGLPVRLKIPSIGVDASIEYVGVTPAGDMASPGNANVAGWYKFGAIPGDPGTAVMAGHVVNIKGAAGVFASLDKVRAGDILQAVDAKGQTASFTVRLIKSYAQDRQPEEVFNSGPGTHLNLITCAGEWDAAHNHYLSRLVVFADSK